MASSASRRLSQVKDFLTSSRTATTIPFDPNCTSFPTRRNLPKIPTAPPGAAWVWGENDYVGRLNLLTPTRVKAAATAEIRTGELVSMNLPLNVPEVPGFGREQFQHTIKVVAENIAFDDLYTMNTQSGTQWDGFRHFAHIPTGTFYNNTQPGDVLGPHANDKCSIHHWSEHGIAGRGILLDYRSYAHANHITYDCYDNHAISYAELYKCGKAQGVDIRPEALGGDVKVGDLLFVRSGWVETYHATPAEERKRLALRPHAVGPEDGQRYAGLAQEEEMLDWLHDCWFAAVAGDAPAFEAWPSHQDWYLHEHILALWGCPLGEMLDLEKLSRRCKEQNRWTFFVTSAPANCPGGVSSHVNATAIF